MEWSQFKREFQEVVLSHLDRHHQAFIVEVEQARDHWTYDEYKDLPLKEFMKQLTLKRAGEHIRQVVKGITNGGVIDFTVGPASYMLLDDPCVLATVYKESNRRI